MSGMSRALARDLLAFDIGPSGVVAFVVGHDDETIDCCICTDDDAVEDDHGCCSTSTRATRPPCCSPPCGPARPTCIPASGHGSGGCARTAAGRAAGLRLVRRRRRRQPSVALREVRPAGAPVDAVLA